MERFRSRLRVLEMRQRSERNNGNVLAFGRTAFERVIQPHLPGLRRMALRLAGNRDDAEDLLQDLVAHLYADAGSLLALDDPGPWLRRVLYRRFVDRWRRQQADPVEYAGDDVIEPVTAPADAPDAEFDRALERERLQATLDTLSLDHRSVLLLHDVEGYTLPELAVILDTAEGTLKSRLHRARNQLRARLLAQDGTNSAVGS